MCRKDSLTQKGTELITALDGLLADVHPEGTAWCYKHQRLCRIPEVPPESMGFHCAGTTCVDFSSRSKTQLRELGQNMVPFAGWARLRSLRCEELVLHECVASHPSLRLVKRYLQATHFIWTFIICPSIIGYPTIRKRRFTICLHRSRAATPLFRSMAPPSVMFKFTVVACGSIYFSALPCEVDSYLAQCGAATFREALPRGARSRRSTH